MRDDPPARRLAEERLELGDRRRLRDDEVSPLGFCVVLRKPPDLPQFLALVRLHLRGEEGSITG